MSKLLKKLAKKNKVIVTLFFITTLSYLITYGVFTYFVISFKSVETLVRYSLIILFFVYLIFYIIYSLVRIIQNKNKKFILVTIISYIFISIFVVGIFFADTVLGMVSSFGEQKEVNYTVYLIDKTGEEVEKEDLIGIIAGDTKEIDNMLASKLLSTEKLKNETKEYNDYFVMMSDFYSGEIDSVIVPFNYVTLFETEKEYENITKETVVLYEYTEKLENEDASITASKDFSEPLTFLIMGVDSAAEGLDSNSAFNGDTLMMVTFNPHTLNATMLSIPRDTLVPIACQNGAYSKINSSAAYGTDCVINTVQNLTGIDIDYYVKINFKGLVELVDALGGIEVDVEVPDYDNYGDNQVCEQDSNRLYSNLVCMNSGIQLLNGEQALAYSRNRHQYTLSDIDRTRHQQQVVTAISNKVAQISTIDEFEKIFETVSNNIYTNMTEDQIISGYSVFKDVLVNSYSDGALINIENSFLEVYNLDVYLNTSTSFQSSSLGYYQDSIDEINKMMRINLELEEPELIKEASFSINDPYISLVAGEGNKSKITSQALKNYIGSSKSDAQSFCTSYGISCTFTEVDSNNSHFNSGVEKGLISDQDVKIGTLISSISKIEFFINGETIKNTTTDSSDEEDQEYDPIQDMIE